MPIRITCPHCKRGMLVDERLAGKKGKCKACQHVLTVPPLPNAASGGRQPPVPTQQEADPPRSPEPPPPGDVEAEAAALFADEPKPAEPVETQTIDLNCPFCDEAIHFSSDLAGKRAPCPECKRIIKVPELVKNEPKDWRKVETRGPAGARLPDQPAPEGAWGSTSAGRVGTQSLVEAGVIPKVERPRTRWQKIRWPVLGASLLLVLGLGSLWGYRWLGRRAIERAVQEALTFADSPEAKPADNVALAAAASEYYLNGGTSASRPPAVEANNQLGKALTTLRSMSPSTERDALLADLALAQVELGGDPPETEQELRLPWDKTQQLLLASLREIHNAEARLYALRAVATRLVERGQASRALPLTNQLFAAADADKAAALAAVGLDFFKAGDRPSAERAAEAALQLYPKDAKPKDAKPKDAKQPLPLRAEVVALALLLEKKPPPAADDADDIGNEHIGKIEALARQGNWVEARKQAGLAGDYDEIVQFRARLAVAAAAVDAQLSETTDIESALKMAEGLGKKTELSWSMLYLIQIALHSSVPEERVLAAAEKIGNKTLRGRAQLAVFRARLDKTNQAVEDSAADHINATGLARSLAALALARHNARWGGNYAAVVQSWPQPLRAFGDLGLALGDQDKRRGR